MSVRIRLRRLGAKKRPFYRVVVADQRSPRDGRFIEAIGKYHPLDDPSLIEIDEEKALEWLNKGAQPSQAVQNLLRVTGIWEKFSASRPQRPTPKAPARKTPTAKAGAASTS
jgi:small subunit ribosomal protein S16